MKTCKDIFTIVVSCFLKSLIAFSIMGFFWTVDRCWVDHGTAAHLRCGIQSHPGSSIKGTCPANAFMYNQATKVTVTWKDFRCPGEPTDLSDSIKFGRGIAIAYIALMVIVFCFIVTHDLLKLCKKKKIDSCCQCFTACDTYMQNVVTGVYAFIFLVAIAYFIGTIVTLVKIGGILHETFHFNQNCACKCDYSVETLKIVQGVVYACLAILLPGIALYELWSLRNKPESYFSIGYFVPLEKVSAKHTTDSYFDPDNVTDV